MSRSKRERMIVGMVATKPRETPPPESKKLVTAEEFLLMPKSLNKPELIEGEVVEMSPVGGPHGELQITLGAALRPHVKRTKQGKVFAELGFVLSRSPDTVRAPDVSFVSASQLREHPLGEGYYEGYPELPLRSFPPTTGCETSRRRYRVLRCGHPSCVAGAPRSARRDGALPRWAWTAIARR